MVRSVLMLVKVNNAGLLKTTIDHKLKDASAVSINLLVRNFNLCIKQ